MRHPIVVRPVPHPCRWTNWNWKNKLEALSGTNVQPGEMPADSFLQFLQQALTTSPCRSAVCG